MELDTNRRVRAILTAAIFLSAAAALTMLVAKGSVLLLGAACLMGGIAALVAGSLLVDFSYTVIGLFAVLSLFPWTRVAALWLPSPSAQVISSVSVIILGGALLWLVRRSILRQRLIPRTPLDLPIVLFGISGLLVSLLAVNPPRSLRWLVVMCSCWMFYYLILCALERPHQLRRVLLGLSLVATVVAAYAMTEYLTGINLIYALFKGTVLEPAPWVLGKIGVGPVGNPLVLATFLVSLAFLPLYGWRTSTGSSAKVFWLACFAVTIGGLLVTFSRGPWLALVLGLLVYLSQARTKGLVPLGVVTVMTLAVLVPLLAARYFWVVKMTALSMRDPSVGHRVIMASSLLQLFCERPVVGVGYTNFIAVYSLYRAADPVILPVADNQYLSLLAETGVVGTVPFLLLVAVLVVGSVRAYRRAQTVHHKEAALCILCGLLAFLAVSATFDTLYQFPSHLAFCALAALAVGVMQYKPQGPQVIPEREVHECQDSA